MDLKHLEYFTAVARCGSINRAAQALYISQPHLSHIIRDLEQDVGKKLLVRAQHGVILTGEGELFLQHAQNILSEMRALRDVCVMPAQQEESLRVSMTKFSHVMESFIDVCRQRADLPRFFYQLNEESTRDVLESVANGAADIGVIHFDHTPASPYRALLAKKQLDYRQLYTCTPHIVISERHPLVMRGEPVTLEALRDYGFVRYIGQYEDFAYTLSVGGVVYDLDSAPKLVSCYGRATLLHTVAETNFYTIGIRGFAGQSSYGVVSLPVPGCDNVLEFGCVRQKGAPPSELVDLFISSVCQRLTGNGEGLSQQEKEVL